jgi:hypothetical protein
MRREHRGRGFRDALRAYVLGHDRVVATESGLTRAAEPESPETDLVWDGEWTHASDPTPRYGVGIPDRLDFHRGPATWREDDVGAPRRSGDNDGP